ncbi:MAG TPA: hypothetical protein VGE41_08350, partial [Verrucomicrobiae bacterium]
MKTFPKFLLRLLCLTPLLLLPALTYANNISYFKTYYNVDYIATGVGGLRDVGSGKITLTNLTGTVKQAYLYWHGPMVMAAANNPLANATVKVNNQTVTGVNIGFSDDNCWGGYGFALSQAYRADITSLVASNRNGTYVLTNFMKAIGTNTHAINVNGASMVVVYDDGNPNNNRDLVLFDGNDSNADNMYDEPGWNVHLAGINYTSGPVALHLHVSDGQVFNPNDDGPVVLNGSVVLEPRGHVFSGDTNFIASANNGPINNGCLWDIKNYQIGAYMT